MDDIAYSRHRLCPFLSFTQSHRATCKYGASLIKHSSSHFESYLDTLYHNFMTRSTHGVSLDLIEITEHEKQSLKKCITLLQKHQRAGCINMDRGETSRSQSPEWSGEPVCCRAFRPSNGRSPKRYNTDNRNPGQPPPKRGDFKGTCRACGMQNHHAHECHFLKKLQIALVKSG